jgi:hypothetical protein
MATEVPSIMQIAETGKAEDLWEELRSKSDSSLYYFAKVVMNYRDLTDHLHLPFCEEIQARMDDPLQGYLMMRGGFKSTIRTKAYMLWRYLKDHTERFLNIGASDTIAKKALIDIKWNILNNQLLRWLYPELQSVDPNSGKWTDAEILLPRDGTFDEPTITCDGINAKRTGFHYTEIIFDDPVAEVDADSPVHHEAAWAFIQYSRGLLENAETRRRCFLGTRWKHGTADVFGKIMANMLPESTWYIRSAIEDGKPTFPERLNLTTLEKIHGEMGDYKYNCQYMNRPSMPGSTDFEETWIGSYSVAEDGFTIIPSDGSPRVSTGQLLRISFYDPSGGGLTAGCENAIVVIGEDQFNRIFVLAEWGEVTSIGQAVEHWHILHDQWKCYKNFYERKGAQSSVEDFCKERRFQHECPYCLAGHINPETNKYHKNPHSKITAIPFSHPGGASAKSKDERIRFYAQKPFEERRIYLHPKHAAPTKKSNTWLRKQITEFPHGDMVDRFDALASAIKLSRPPIRDEEVESAKAAEQVAKMAGKNFTHQEYDRGGYA